MITISTGIHTNIEAEVYHAAPGVSNSMLKCMDRTPAHFKAAMAEPHETTPAMILGTLTHSLVLEPEKPLPQLIIPPEKYPAPENCSLVKSKKVAVGDMIAWSGNATWCQSWIMEQKKAGRMVVTQKDMASLLGMVASIAAHPVARKIITTAATEVSLFTRSPKFDALFGEDNPLLKCRMDIVPKNKKYLADIKTCEDAGADFEKTVFTYGYFQQAAFYLDIWNALNPEDKRHHFVFIAVEKTPPYAVRLVGLKESAIKAGRGLYFQRLTTWVKCTRSGIWPAYEQKITEIDIPSWAHSLLERGAM